jgi:hypothetical protein
MADRYYRLEGFYVGVSTCKACGKSEHCVVFPEMTSEYVQCGHCGAMAGVFKDTTEESSQE